MYKCRPFIPRDKVVFEKPKGESDEGGSPINSYDDFYTSSAEIYGKSSTEVNNVSQIVGVTTYTIRIQFTEKANKIKHSFRVRVLTKRNSDDQYLQLELLGSSINENSENKFLIFKAIESEV